MTGQTSQSNKEDFTLQNHPAGRIQPCNGTVLARRPYGPFIISYYSRFSFWTRKGIISF